MIIITGGAGFIGSNFILEWLRRETVPVINLDKLTYAGNPDNLAELAGDARYSFVRGDISDRALVESLLAKYRPDAIIHFAAESHVDRSIHGPDDFVQTNVVGTFTLLEAARAYWNGLEPGKRGQFRFVHVSTDEVYGSLGIDEPAFTEASAYAPRSPYSASKAASDHLARAYFETYGLPVVVTNCSNNYGPRQFPEKLIPLMVLNAGSGKQLPVYGDGRNVRDWLYVTDHCDALRMVLRKGRAGQTYNIGGDSERTNIEVVRAICLLLDEMNPASAPHDRLIEFVADRPGHDRRYALDTHKIRTELGWQPVENFEAGLRKTVKWYLDHPEWVARIASGAYKKWIEVNYRARGTA